MAKSRIELDAVLRDILENDHCYFQPPESVKLKYPCIIYERSRFENRPADDIPYLTYKGYTLTVIYKNPDSDLPDKIESLPMCSFDRHYTADNLNHDIFTIYW